MGRLEQIYRQRMIKYLSGEASKLITMARSRKDTENISYTQRDAYGALICYQGSVVYTLLTAATTDAKAPSYTAGNYGKMDDLGYGGRHKGYNGIPEGTGVEWATEFARSYKPRSKGWELVVFNAAFYSEIQERGGGSLKRTYRIISQIFGEMDNIAAKFKGATVSGYNLRKR